MTTDPSADEAPHGAPPRGLEIRGSADALLDEPLLLRARGAGPDAAMVWQARYLDDEARVWRAAGSHAQDLLARLAPAKAGTGPLAALGSLRPVSVEVRAQAPDGRAATRTITRRLAAEGVRVRRWRDGLTATLHLPSAGEAPCATVVLDATGGQIAAHVATLAAPLLASRGVLVLSVGPARAEGSADRLALARHGLAAVPAAASDPVVLRTVDPFTAGGAGGAGDAVVLPPGVGARDVEPGAAVTRAAAWDTLLERLGARPRERGAPAVAADGGAGTT